MNVNVLYKPGTRLMLVGCIPSLPRNCVYPVVLRCVNNNTFLFSKMSPFSPNHHSFHHSNRLFRRLPNCSELFAGALRASRAIARPMSATRFGNRILQPSLLLHGFCTGPPNRAPFQSTGPRPDIIKLEDRTASRTASLDQF